MYDADLTPLRLARIKARLPQYVAAKRAQMIASRLSVLERGYDRARPHERAALACVLGVPVEELFPVPPSQPTTPTASPGASN
jgi:hypothetical protein